MDGAENSCDSRLFLTDTTSAGGLARVAAARAWPRKQGRYSTPFFRGLLMSIPSNGQRVLVAMLIAAMSTPSLWAGGPVQETFVQRATTPAEDGVFDVALYGKQRLLFGQLVDSNGQEVAGAEVVIRHEGHAVAKTKTDAKGRFIVQGLRPGKHEVVSGKRSENFRFWTGDKAPEHSGRAALLVTGDGVLRGQMGGQIIEWLTNPWVLAALTATAIAVPLALSSDDDDPPSGTQ